jgi:hypothetical protein
MNSRKFILFIAFLFVTIISYGQTFNYSYTDPCTGVVKTMQIPTNGITVTYYGEVNTFQPSDFYNGGFESWAQGVYSSFGNNNPCASVVGLPTGINIAQNTATNFLSIVNSLSAISDLAALNGATNILSGVGSVSNASGNGGKKENKKGGNGTTTTNSEGSTQTPSGSSTPSGTSGNQGTSSESSGTSNIQGSNTTGSTQSTQTGNQPSQPPVGSQQNQSGSNGSTNNNTSGSNSSGTSNTSGSTNNTQSSTGSNQTQTTNGTQTNGTQSGNTSSGSSNANSGNANQNGSGTSGSNGSSNQNGSGSNTAGESKGSGTENQQGGSEATKTEEGGKTNLVGGSVASIGNSTGSGSASSESRKPTILGSSDFVGFNFRDSDVSQGAKVTGGYTSLRWDGQRSHGILVDYTTALKGPNITGFYAIIKKKRIDLISTTLTLGFDRKTSVYGTLALGQMWNIDKKKKFKAVYMLTGSFGSVYGEEFVGTAAIAGVMYDLKVSKRIDIKLMGLYVYAPYVSYYNDILLKSPHVVLPIIGTNIGLTKRFKLNINGGGAWAINENALNYTIMMGTRFLL